MTDRPILFNAPMVQALFDGRKTQTRRVLAEKYRGALIPAHSVSNGQSGPIAHEYDRTWPVRTGFAVGDRLWVRETWCHTGDHVFEIHQARMRGRGGVIFAADSNPDFPHAKWWPSIHMPREFSRITLTVTDVRVERLQDISEADAIAEGVPDYTVLGGDEIKETSTRLKWPQRAYADLWESINGPGSWDANPWVVALTFDVALRNIDAAS